MLLVSEFAALYRKRLAKFDVDELYLHFCSIAEYIKRHLLFYFTREIIIDLYAIQLTNFESNLAVHCSLSIVSHLNITRFRSCLYHILFLETNTNI